MRAPAGDVARGRRELRLRAAGPLEQRLGVADEHERGIGQADAAAGALEQRHARLALEHRQLLGDGGRRELQRVGDRGDRAARLQLVQQAQAAARSAFVRNATDSSQEIKVASARFVVHHRPMPSPGALLCLASAAAFGAMGIFGKLAYEEGANVGTLLAARFVLAAALFWLVAALHARRERPARAAAPRRRDRPRARRRRLQRPGGRLLRGARAPRRLAALAARLHVPRDRGGDRDRDRARAGEPADRRHPGARLDRARPRPGGRGRRRARPARDGAGPRGRGRLQRLHPQLRGHRRADRPARPRHARLHRRGDDPDARRHRRRRSSTRAA